MAWIALSSVSKLVWQDQQLRRCCSMEAAATKAILVFKSLDLPVRIQMEDLLQQSLDRNVMYSLVTDMKGNGICPRQLFLSQRWR